MKRVPVVLFLLIGFMACKEHKHKDNETIENLTTFAHFGKEITKDDAISLETMASKFEALREGDTINVKFASKVNEVCKAKGCWMKLDLGDEKETMVRFTDYGFFVPLDSDDKEVIVEGKAYVTKIPIKELRHYAEDAGKSEEEIAKITEPEFTYAFQADGVLMKR